MDEQRPAVFGASMAEERHRGTCMVCDWTGTFDTLNPIHDHLWATGHPVSITSSGKLLPQIARPRPVLKLVEGGLEA